MPLLNIDRRAFALVAIVIALTVPAVALRVLCVGRSCDQEQQADSKVPFCSLPAHTRSLIAAGARDGRSPDVLAVTQGDVQVFSKGVAGDRVAWPSIESTGWEAPVVLSGKGVRRGIVYPTFGLEDIGPTLSQLTGVPIPHPEVRSGRPLRKATTGEAPSLVLLVVVQGAEDSEVEAASERLAREGGSGRASLPSLPHDPAAVMTTIGTGGLPSEHGITGTHVRNEEGKVAAAWSLPSLRVPRPGYRAAPPTSVIATFADDLDEELEQKPKIGLVADTFQARGLVGGDWYVDHDRDDTRIVATGDIVATSRRMMENGYGDDRIPDLIGVVTTGSDGASDALRIVRTAQKATRGDVAAAITLLPASAPDEPAVPARRITALLEQELGSDVVEVDTAGGWFLDQDRLASTGITRDEVVRTLDQMRIQGRPVFADVFPSLAVAFARFC